MRLAIQLYEGFEGASRNTNNAVLEARKFSPSASKRHFRLTLLDSGEITLLPRVLEHLDQMVSSIGLNIIPLGIDRVAT